MPAVNLCRSCTSAPVFSLVTFAYGRSLLVVNLPGSHSRIVVAFVWAQGVFTGQRRKSMQPQPVRVQLGTRPGEGVGCMYSPESILSGPSGGLFGANIRVALSKQQWYEMSNLGKVVYD